jgi:uncharacterized Tic20 family protein
MRKLKANWVAITVAVAVLIAVAMVVSNLWSAVGASQISLAGWLAMIFGVLLTLALGIGLMALVFISNRRGYDEPGRRDC